MTHRRNLKSPLTLLIVTALFVTSLFVGNQRVRADHGNNDSTNALDKCSADLIQLSESSGGTHVKVIVQASADSGLLDSVIRDFGGVVLTTLSQLTHAS